MENLSNEIWKPIKEYEGLYEISNLGKVKSLRHNKIMRSRNNHLGYSYVNLSHFKDPKTVFIHRLVASHFIPKIEGKNIVNHINEIRHDNRAENLEWCTQKENMNSFWDKRQGKYENLKNFPSKKPLVNKSNDGKNLPREFNPAYLDVIIKSMPDNIRKLSGVRRDINKTKETIELLIEKGYYYSDGKIYNSLGNVFSISEKTMIITRHENNNIYVLAKFFVWYYVFKEIPYNISYIDGNKFNIKVSNLKKVKPTFYKFKNDTKAFEVRICVGGKTIKFGEYINEQCAIKASEYLIEKLS